MLGAGLLWTSLIYMGTAYSIKLKKRISILENTLLLISEMKIQLEYLNMPVYEMIKQMKSKVYFGKLDFLNECCNLIESGFDFPIAWKKAITHSHCYKRDETDKLLHLGENLGTSNLSNQINILNIHSEYFENFLIEAKAKQRKYGNISISVSALAGCMIFIMAI